MYRRLFLFVSVFLLLGACRPKPIAYPNLENRLSRNHQGDVVILLHGLWRDSRAMKPIETYLRTKQYRVLNISYPSTKHSIEVLTKKYLKPVLQQVQLKPRQKIHFVGHSLGGILVRYYLQHHEMPELGRVVMLGTPNHGTRLIDVASDLGIFVDKVGPVAQQLSSRPGSFVRELPPVHFELGVIAGSDSPSWITSLLLFGNDDGVVSVESTKVEGMDDFIVVPARHYRLRGEPAVLQQIAHFLEHGQFAHEGML